MTGISPDVITHKLNVDPSFRPVKQKRRKFAPERNKIIDEEVQNLIDSGKIREVKYPDWLANVVVVSATYQRLVNKMFKDQLGDTMEVYIDDMLVKSRKADDHVEHLRQSFDILKKYGMKLNPTKCSFGVSTGKFLGYIVTQRGIEASPDQVRAIINIQSPRNIKEVQRLTGRVAALNRFISRSSDKCRLFYDVLRKNKGFNWSDDHEAALQNLKKYMMSPPLLSKPKEGEVLQLYLAVSSTAVSAVLAREDEAQQLPIYYISKSLLEAETRYSSLEKLVLALVTAAKKLRHYFETHQIVVMTNYPIKSVMRRPELTGRMEKWTMALGRFDIKYQPRTAVKSQALADFVADFSPDLERIADDEVKLINNIEEIWTLFVDGSSNFRGAGLGVVLKSPQGDMIAHAICYDFKATNNEAEYEALIAGMTLATELGASGLNIFSDSQLIVNQINGNYEAKDLKMTLFGIPSEIICDNGSQFISDKTRAFCKTWNIELKTSTPRYPQANEQAESSNKTIIASLKKRLDDKKGRWAEELPSILWANRTTPRTATGQTPFSLVYGCEAVLPPEVTLPSARYGLMTPEQNDVELSENLDNTEDLREAALIRMASQQQIVAKCFNKNVKVKMFKEGDWVLRKVFQNTKELNAGKLAPAWEGPYLIDKIAGKGAYRLISKDGKSVPRSWNATHLKLYHF
ncbi:uncharacterized protein [Spinacia oleracea]|uniref:Uncharacterized protein n=1 Tax=Spinacia oleracea TaxID=3562 RepID=A0ABM3RJP0_SPIOL|nr:uncharacterized protein LOC130470211 [Spinacia oleracea]